MSVAFPKVSEAYVGKIIVSCDKKCLKIFLFITEKKIGLKSVRTYLSSVP